MYHNILNIVSEVSFKKNIFTSIKSLIVKNLNFSTPSSVCKIYIHVVFAIDILVYNNM